MLPKEQSHRPGHFKQVNKPHNTGRHRSKGQINNANNGKVSVKTLTKRVKKELGREARRHQAQQIRSNKREEMLLQKRNFGGLSAAPILMTLVPLQEDIDVDHVVSMFKNADDNANVFVSPSGIIHIGLPRFKQRFAIIVPPVGNTIATLDAVKVSSTVLLTISSTFGIEKNPRTEIIDMWGEEIMNALVAQSLPTTIVTLTDFENLPVKKRQDFKNNVYKAISQWLPEDKLSTLDKPSDALNILRKAGNQKQRNVTYRDKRAYMIAESVKYTGNVDKKCNGTLAITGYLRGKPLSVNGLIHIPGFGNYQMSQIDTVEDPLVLDKNKQTSDITMGNDVRVLEIANPAKQESLITENVPDPMDAEQTWPTDEEIAEARTLQKQKIVKTVPKGTSEYQAAWIPDIDGEIYDGKVDEESDDDDDDEMSVDKPVSEINSEAGLEDDEEYENMTVSEMAPDELKYDQEIDMQEEMQAIVKYKEAKLDAEFPDEVDTPQDILAKKRFEKYTGLASFRTSPWDVKENLPFDYSRIFQFENFERTRKRVFKEQSEIDGAQPGLYITIHVKDVPRALFDAYLTVENFPLIVFSLMQHECKMSFINIYLNRTTTNGDPIKSKENLVFQCGFRRFRCNPIFSQHTNGNKHKYLRYFQPDTCAVASMYAQISFPPCPVLCYKEKTNGSLELIATGHVLSVNPDRLIIKRVVLSGHPFKVHKHSAVVRFMFYYRDDINWFKPVELYTKYGRRGHIKEPLGTHGHMKCSFNGTLKSQDTILMNLYKRIFPKWTYQPILLIDSSYSSASMDDDVDMN